MIVINHLTKNYDGFKVCFYSVFGRSYGGDRRKCRNCEYGEGKNKHKNKCYNFS